MSSYRTRFIFPFEANWAEAVTKRVNYDLGLNQVGFGAVTREPYQQYVVHGYQFTIEFLSACEINAMERFFAAHFGRQKGWWLRGPQMELEVLAGVSATQFDVRATGEDVALHPSQDLCFEYDSGEYAYARIASLEENEDGSVRVILDSELPAPADDCAVRRLYFVRLDAEEIRINQRGPTNGMVTLKVIELPHEYGSVEAGERPALLYRFIQRQGGEEVSSCWTSHDVAIAYGEETFVPAPFSHGKFSESTESTDSLEITSYMFEGNPLNEYIPFAPQRTIRVEVIEFLLGDETADTLFHGWVRNIEVKGTEIRANCGTRALDLDRLAPRFFFQPVCNYRLGQSGTCSVDLTPFTITGTITAIDGHRIEITAAALAGKPANWFAYGHVSVMGATWIDRRMVRASSVVSGTVHRLKLNARFDSAIVGNTITAVAGCDLVASTCKDKFDNYVNFGGHPKMPVENLMLKAMPVKASGKGGK